MKINVGSKNEVKILAVKESISNYKIFSNVQIEGINANSEISAQPVSMEETIKGAMNRAKNSFKDCDYSFGIEDGLIEVPNTKSNYMNICVCAIYDGQNYHLGLGSAFEHPKKVTNLVLQDNIEITEAFLRTGLIDNPKIGSEEGTIGFLTKGRLPRKEYTKQAIQMALIHIENPNLF
ncbi:MAG: inosine/xanthosine triphosphatase [Candidatus Nanoarchaeia archaeon]|nr:inosine/xanthosine triphosphatase [Candidatus Nanoarchaeia archaeon]